MLMYCFMKQNNKLNATKRLHDDIKRKLKEDKTEEEWIRLQRTGGGAETEIITPANQL